MTAAAAGPPWPDPIVDVADAAFAYGAADAVSGVSFAARAGEFVGLLGPNGAGKSTLVRLVAGLLAPARGTVRLAGLDPFTAPRRTIARMCALVPQEPRIAWPFTVREAVMMGRSPRQGLLALPNRLDRGAVDGALEACDLVHLAERRLDALSGGERRRVFFARALAQEPRVLLLDEPTAFLDLGHQVAAMRMARLAARGGLCVVAVLHDLNLAAATCDRVVIQLQRRGDGARRGIVHALPVADVERDAVLGDEAGADRPPLRVERLVLDPPGAHRDEPPEQHLDAGRPAVRRLPAPVEVGAPVAGDLERAVVAERDSGARAHRRDRVVPDGHEVVSREADRDEVRDLPEHAGVHRGGRRVAGAAHREVLAANAEVELVRDRPGEREVDDVAGEGPLLRAQERDAGGDGRALGVHDGAAEEPIDGVGPAPVQDEPRLDRVALARGDRARVQVEAVVAGGGADARGEAERAGARDVGDSAGRRRLRGEGASGGEEDDRGEGPCVHPARIRRGSAPGKDANSPLRAAGGSR